MISEIPEIDQSVSVKMNGYFGWTYKPPMCRGHQLEFTYSAVIIGQFSTKVRIIYSFALYKNESQARYSTF